MQLVYSAGGVELVIVCFEGSELFGHEVPVSKGSAMVVVDDVSCDS